jgi:hypothetical protein
MDSTSAGVVLVRTNGIGINYFFAEQLRERLRNPMRLQHAVCLNGHRNIFYRVDIPVLHCCRMPTAF